MLPRIHFITSTILAVLLWPFFGFWGLAIYIGGFFVDFDHYLVYVFRKKDWNLFNSIRYFNQGYKEGLYIFHTIETIIPLVLLAPIHLFFLAVLIGVSLHLIMDFMGDIKDHSKIKPLSIIYYLVRQKL
ncbi:MAG: hypothetical protein KAQ83_03020 [Nanoarchaeota archaeon]|nr:hypothetical protein [Nanoarchaeota archaeon]